MNIYAKLDPPRFPNMSLPMAAILGFVLERKFTTPVLADVQVTPDGHVLGWPSGEESVARIGNLTGPGKVSLVYRVWSDT